MCDLKASPVLCVLQGTLQVDLPATLVFDYPTVSAISSYISHLVTPLATSALAQEQHVDGALLSQFVGDLRRLPKPAARLLPAAHGSGAALVGVMKMSSHTAAGDAVMVLPGRDASRRVPFNRWQPDQQDKVGNHKRASIKRSNLWSGSGWKTECCKHPELFSSRLQNLMDSAAA